MTQQTIGIGSSPNDHTGDPLRTAFDKCNQNFTELYQPQRRVTSSPITIAASDVIINVDISSGSPTCTLPDATTRGGKVLIFKDATGNFAGHSLTLTPFTAQTIDTLTTLVLSTNFQYLRLRPFNDGVGAGWSIDQ